VLVTGAAGFLGQQVCAELTRQGIAVRALDLPHLVGRSTPTVQWVGADITGPQAALVQALAGCTHVVHAAATTNGLVASAYYRTNHGGTRNLLEAIARSGVRLRRFVQLSSVAARGPLRAAPVGHAPVPTGPLTEYGWSKHLAEQELLGRSDELPVTILRPPPMYGPGDRQTLEVFRLADKGLDLQIGGGFARLSLLFGPDCARAVVRALTAELPSGTILHPTGPAPVTSDELAAAVVSAVGRRRHLRVKVPPCVVELAARVADRLGALQGAALPFNSFKAPELLAPDWHIDAAPAQQALGWAPQMDLFEGMHLTAKWYRHHEWL
jgi:nucleoside-diphosphate-sugar epimerase